MPLIRPFRALRYGPNHLEHLDELISPASRGEPEDRRIVGPVHPHCVRQLVRGDRGPLASAGDPPFTHAARMIQGWKEDGIFVRDPRPALYSYEQRCGDVSHRGLVACVRLGLDSDPLLPHEGTRGRTTKVLLDGLRAMRTQLSLAVGLVEDATGALSEHLQGGVGRPHLVAEDGNGWLNRVWRDEDPQLQLRLAGALRGEVTVVADGHHRLEAAQRYRAEQGREGSTRERPSDYLSMLLVPARDALQRSQPTHRVCISLSSEAHTVVDGLSAAFEVVDLDSDEALFRFLDDRSGIRFGMAQPGRRQGLVLRPDAPLPSEPDELPAVLADVDAAILDVRALRPIEEALGSGFRSLTETGSSGSPFSHNRSSRRDILGLVDGGAADLAFLLRPALPEQVLEVARAGGMMPPKSTNFLPKPAKGLLMNSLHSF